MVKIKEKKYIQFIMTCINNPRTSPNVFDNANKFFCYITHNQNLFMVVEIVKNNKVILLCGDFGKIEISDTFIERVSNE